MIRQFRAQHEEILQILHKLKDLAKDVVKNYNQIARHLIMLRYKVKVHLSSEDKILFPVVRNNGNEEETSLLASYEEEMNGLAGVFLEFIECWEFGEQILESPEEFLQQAVAAIEALTKRIDKEESELYPAISVLQEKAIWNF